MTIRQYAEQLKQDLGFVLGVFEASQNIPVEASTTQAAWLASAITAAGPVLISFPITDPAKLAAVVIALGPILQLIAPAA